MRGIGCLFLSLVALGLVGCSSQPEQGRYRLASDEAPLRTPTAAELYPLTPRPEAIGRRGNLPYEINGQHYRVLSDANGFVEEGIASWYGQKFHGHLTSLGEHYDMYSLSAAHKTLPLPTWVRVTNLENGKSVIVRVNDRGPFHSDRVIDLSFSAAYAIDMHRRGTAPVRVEAITFDQPGFDDIPAHFIQIAAAREQSNLERLATQLKENYQLSATTRYQNGLNRLYIGPFTERQTIHWINQLQQDGFQGIFRVPVENLP
ncbi:septal ring lytic transglycosylase RlpA family protein [Aliidiomarina sanyensis]|uniref:Endolytic peptidoglycan transglycosylase RlpA n=1 Tax=Aliidiomarina sanyensis TaxID=1249555 RepID=A0A432WER8_9GAMM|nr:septal ring lytic transglycosylase RlpA family protein [Aliidiomarina sanyensis]RUO31387.1 septal ring lytic transglycosylase RlpA [Aliidiomarina sanyensis]